MNFLCFVNHKPIKISISEVIITKALTASNGEKLLASSHGY